MCSSATGRQIQLTAQAPKQNLSAETRRMRLVLDWESAASWERTRAGLVAGPEAVIAQGVRYVHVFQHGWFAWPGIQVRMGGNVRVYLTLCLSLLPQWCTSTDPGWSDPCRRSEGSTRRRRKVSLSRSSGRTTLQQCRGEMHT